MKDNANDADIDLELLKKQIATTWTTANLLKDNERNATAHGLSAVFTQFAVVETCLLKILEKLEKAGD